MTARIYRPAPNAMQSGEGNSKRWLLVSEPATARQIEPLMGYTSSTDTETQVKLYFDTLDEAEAYAQRAGIPYRVHQPHEAIPKRNSYSDNVRSDRKQPWTHRTGRHRRPAPGSFPLRRCQVQSRRGSASTPPRTSPSGCPRRSILPRRR